MKSHLPDASVVDVSAKDMGEVGEVSITLDSTDGPILCGW